MPTKLCHTCGTRALPGTSRCAQHPARWANGSTRQWRTQRAGILANNPYCWCGDRAVEVHHLVPGSNRVAPTTELQPVCHTHNPRGNGTW